ITAPAGASASCRSNRRCVRYRKAASSCSTGAQRRCTPIATFRSTRISTPRRIAKLVELFTVDHERLAAHARLSGSGKFSTEEQHYPDGKLSVRRFEVRSAQAEAERVGPKTLELVQSLIHSSHPLRYLRRVQG